MVESTDNQSNGRYIITGGPGSGKTTLVEGLRALGYIGFPEIARDLITKGITPPGWTNKPDFSRFFELILQQRIICHQQIKGSETGFFDRGIPDSLAYIKHQKRKIPHALTEAIETYRYNPAVFVLPPWEEIYETDNVRKESFSEATELYFHVIEAYQDSGYKIIELPKVSIEQRLTICCTQLTNFY